MSKDIEFLKNLFLSDLNTGEKSQIIKVEGAESGKDHLCIYTQSSEQKANGIVTLFKVFSTEESAETTVDL